MNDAVFVDVYGWAPNKDVIYNALIQAGLLTINVSPFSSKEDGDTYYPEEDSGFLIDDLGSIIDQEGEYDNDGNVITEQTFKKGFFFNLRFTLGKTLKKTRATYNKVFLDTNILELFENMSPYSEEDTPNGYQNTDGVRLFDKVKTPIRKWA